MLNALITPPASPYAEVRLFLFPYAGGSASVYARLMTQLSPPILPSAVEYPGHGLRLGELPALSMRSLVADLVDVIGATAQGRYAFFGHSMGGLVAFELAAMLKQRGLRLPEHLFISAANPGPSERTVSLVDADDTAVLAELRSLGGTPPELLADRRLMELVIPTVRADYVLLGNYRGRDDQALDVPFTVLGGREDAVCPVGNLHRWRQRTTQGCRLKILSGGHFFVNEAPARVASTINETLAPAWRWDHA